MGRVLKMVPVKIGNYATMQRHSFVMPGAELGDGAVLFEESQVLKGEQVPQDEIWAGNPAEQIKVKRSKLWRVPRLAKMPEAVERQHSPNGRQHSPNGKLAVGELVQPLL